MSVVYKLIRPEVKLDGDTLTVALSTEAKDRDGDIIRAAGWELDNFLAHPVLLSSHDYGTLRSQIGEWEDVKVVKDKLIGSPKYYVDQGNPEADWGYKLARSGKAAYSVGFIPIDSNLLKGYGAYEYTKQELLECSHVTVPANAQALQLMAKGARGPVADYFKELQAKWPSDLMDPDAPYYTGTHCIVPGCDDASQLSVPICSEHLKVLMNADAEPPGGEADEELMQQMGFFAKAWSEHKAGRTISGPNMTRVHTILDAAHSMHDAGDCTDGDCPYGSGSSGKTAAKALDLVQLFERAAFRTEVSA